LIPAEVARQLEVVWARFNQQSEIQNQKSQRDAAQ
jgi:hypothetical protein